MASPRAGKEGRLATATIDRSGVSPWAPLQVRPFRALWTALACAQMVNWMHVVGAAAVVASLTSSAALVALVQTANGLPSVLFALLAGAAADVVDRPRLLIGSLLFMAASTGTLAALAIAGATTAVDVLLLTFALGAGFAVASPTFGSLTSELSGRELLPSAVALNSIAVNLARALGPAIAGALLAGLSAGALFGIETGVLLLAIAAVAGGVRTAAAELPGAREQFVGAIRAGARFARFSTPVRAVMLRAATFLVCASALWALLPVVALGPLDVGADGLGVLLGCAGVGALACAAVLPRLRQALSPDHLVATGAVGLTIGLVVLAFVREPVVVGAGMALAGASWLAALTSINTAAQLVAPGWVRARTLATYQIAYQGAMALGSLVWGVVAQLAGLRAGLLVPAAGILVGLVSARRWPLTTAGAVDVSPAPWPDPMLANEPAAEDGPVLVTIEYRVAPDEVEQFLAAMHHLGRVRRRDGAFRWGVYEDLVDEGHWVETFLVDSWAEHIRQHTRATMEDEAVEARVLGLRAGPPNHWLRRGGV